MYTVDYFIKKFEAIPEEDWNDNATACAYTHCGQYGHGYKNECPALSELFKKIHYKSKCQQHRDAIGENYHGWSYMVVSINDGLTSNDTPYQQPTPKQRILAALYDIKKLNYKCWDDDNERWRYSTDQDTVFTFRNGKWHVTYTKEITIAPDGIEMDVPVEREVEGAVIEVI
jgi:hypothetical protein